MKLSCLSWTTGKLRIVFALMILFCMGISSSTLLSAAEFIPLGYYPDKKLGSRAIDISVDGQVIMGITVLSDDSSRQHEVFRWTSEKGMVPIGETMTNVVGMSADGSTIAWYASVNGPGNHRIWTEDTGILELNLSIAYGRGISDDGDVVVGWGDPNGANVFSYFRWTPGGGVASFELPRQRADRLWVSPDGSVISGTLQRDTGTNPVDYQILRQPFRWTENSGTTMLGGIPDHNFYGVTGISSDASVITGVSGHVPINTGDYFVESVTPLSLWRWTEGAGLVLLEAGTPDSSFQRMERGSSRQWISADGSVIFGDVRSVDGQSASVYRWTDSIGLEVLPTLQGYSHSAAVDMTPDAKWVFGQSWSPPFVQKEMVPWLWSEETGLINLLDVIEAQGLGQSIADWGQLWAFAFGRIAADARAIIGDGINPDGVQEGWVVYLDPLDIEGDFNRSGELNAPDIDLLAEQISAGLHTSVYDLNDDELVNAEDRRIWVEELANTYFGDANLDGEFGTRDLEEIIIAGEYEDAIDGNSTWATGDWNGDGDFTSSDLTLALQSGGFEKGPRVAVRAVPEPTGITLMAIGLIGLLRAFRPSRRP